MLPLAESKRLIQSPFSNPTRSTMKLKHELPNERDSLPKIRSSGKGDCCRIAALSLDLRGNSGTVLSNSCGSLKASGADVRRSVHA